MTVLFPSSTRSVSLDKDESNTLPSISLPWKQKAKANKTLNTARARLWFHAGMFKPSDMVQCRTGRTGMLSHWERGLLTCCAAPSSPRRTKPQITAKNNPDRRDQPRTHACPCRAFAISCCRFEPSRVRVAHGATWTSRSPTEHTHMADGAPARSCSLVLKNESKRREKTRFGLRPTV